MLIFPDKNLTYLATPKTGSTAIELALRSRAEIVFSKRRKHMTALRFKTKLAPFLRDTFDIQTETVAVMRSPVDQIRSWYKYRARPAVAGGPRSTGDLTFDEFVMEVVRDAAPDFARIGSQHAFLTDAKGRLAVDHLFAYEEQEQLLAFLSERLGATIELKRKNVSPKVEATLSTEVETVLRAARPEEFSLYSDLMAAGGHITLS